MQTHPKKRIDIIIEMPLLGRITDCFDKAGVSGYSVLPVIAGSGRSGSWSAGGQVSSVGQMAALICIIDAGKVDDVLAQVFAVVRRQIGLVTISDVAVVRPERF